MQTILFIEPHLKLRIHKPAFAVFSEGTHKAVWEAHGTIWLTAIGVSLLNLLMVR